MSTLIVHAIDPLKVTDAVERKIARYQESRQRHIAEHRQRIEQREAARALGQPTPQGKWSLEELIEQEETFCATSIAQERQHYARVRVVEDATGNPEKPFFLVYGDDPNKGPRHRTGGFESVEKATAWFMSLGR